ncbi:hypothetical protein [Streptomyces uncialis]|uniref:hypothetical protein n=1 Tax=Streptomyces uncialis TaxID=1048205 RepID=UPI002257025D|nr:hypothetical protein [Streptomyces uncialis]MCX4662780.1 hypothetical protein [Streptomyces uncialis]
MVRPSPDPSAAGLLGGARTSPPVGAGAVRVDVATGPAASFTGLRVALGELRSRGATFGGLSERYAAEWAELFPGGDGAPDALGIAEIALAPSERRLHRESEQNYRVLATAAAALCAGAEELGRPLELSGVGGTDLSSLRGFMRAVEHSRTRPGAELRLDAPERVAPPVLPEADYRAERARCLRRMGVPVDVASLRTELPAYRPGPDPVGGQEAALLAAAFGDGTAFDRLTAVLAGCRRGFFTGNWEAMAALAGLGGRLLDGFPDASVGDLLTAAREQDLQAEAIEFEPGILRTADDVRAFLLKVLGVQATFRGRQDQALAYFRAMREGERLSPEVRSQSHLYAALTLTKRLGHVGDAVAELEQGFAAVPHREGEEKSVRRERGWLHNLRALTHFAQKELRDAFGHEKQALACIEGLDDASSIHLRVNLFSNISVLQEKAGRHPQAARTWARFKEAAGSGNATFVKHHAYRAAGLALLCGDRDAALEDLSRSVACAAEFDDDFHEAEIRLETGTLHLADGQRAEAAGHFERAVELTARIGDPYRMALAGVGRAEAAGTAPDSSLGELALRGLTRPGDGAELAARIAKGDTAGLLPRVRTKLNRPFDLINFQE